MCWLRGITAATGWQRLVPPQYRRKERLARSFAVGLFIGMLPFTGLLAALAVAVVCRLHKRAAAAGALVNNPWTTPCFLWASYRIGTWLTGMDRPLTWPGWAGLCDPQWWWHVLVNGWPTVAGALALGAVLGLASYVAVLTVLLRRRRGA